MFDWISETFVSGISLILADVAVAATFVALVAGATYLVTRKSGPTKIGACAALVVVTAISVVNYNSYSNRKKEVIESYKKFVVASATSNYDALEMFDERSKTLIGQIANEKNTSNEAVIKQMNLGVDTHDKYTVVVKGKHAKLHISRRAPGTVGLVEKPKEYEIKFVRTNDQWKISL